MGTLRKIIWNFLCLGIFFFAFPGSPSTFAKPHGLDNDGKEKGARDSYDIKLGNSLTQSEIIPNENVPLSLLLQTKFQTDQEQEQSNAVIFRRRRISRSPLSDNEKEEEDDEDEEEEEEEEEENDNGGGEEYDRIKRNSTKTKDESSLKNASTTTTHSPIEVSNDSKDYVYLALSYEHSEELEEINNKNSNGNGSSSTAHSYSPFVKLTQNEIHSLLSSAPGSHLDEEEKKTIDKRTQALHKLLYQPEAPPPPDWELPLNYNNLVIPKSSYKTPFGDGHWLPPVPVGIFLSILAISDIDEKEETITLDIDILMKWKDGYLVNGTISPKKTITLNPEILKKLWRPDVFIEEVVKVRRPHLMNQLLSLKLTPFSGQIEYMSRVKVKLDCEMFYTFYPADVHRCNFTLRSYSYLTKDIAFRWLNHGVHLNDPSDPNFDIQVASTDHTPVPNPSNEEEKYDALEFTIALRRKIQYHLVQTYMPSFGFIVITWLCFLVPSRMVEARIGISMTTLLTLTAMFSSVRESSPAVSYVKAIDVWMVFCIFSVFLTLLEFVCLVWLQARLEDEEEDALEESRRQASIERKSKGGREDEESGINAARRRRSSRRRSTMPRVKTAFCWRFLPRPTRKHQSYIKIIEKYAFPVFAVIFVTFNAIYWGWLLVSSGYFHEWKVNTTLNSDCDKYKAAGVHINFALGRL